MKKSKILVPALGILALGMSAAVTGTVAWFSTNRTVYANGIQFQSATAQSLVIALAEEGPWGTVVNHNVAAKDATLMPAYLLDTLTDNKKTYSNSEKPSFVELNTTFMNANSSTYYVAADGKVKKVADDSVVTPAKPGAEAGPFQEAGTTAVKIFDDYLKIDGGTTDTATYTKITVAKADTSSNENIDKALRVGFFDGTNFEICTPFPALTDASYTFKPSATFDVNGTAKKVSIYVWYDGEDAACINANAIENPINVTAVYSLDAFN